MQSPHGLPGLPRRGRTSPQSWPGSSRNESTTFSTFAERPRSGHSSTGRKMPRTTPPSIKSHLKYFERRYGHSLRIEGYRVALLAARSLGVHPREAKVALSLTTEDLAALKDLVRAQHEVSLLFRGRRSGWWEHRSAIETAFGTELDYSVFVQARWPNAPSSCSRVWETARPRLPSRSLRRLSARR